MRKVNLQTGSTRGPNKAPPVSGSGFPVTERLQAPGSLHHNDVVINFSGITTVWGTRRTTLLSHEGQE